MVFEKVMAILTAFAVLGVVFGALKLNGCFCKIEAGQRWEETLKKGNPFEAMETVTNTVIAVKGGYVRFYDGNRTNVSSKGVFVYHSEKIGNKK